ncbi:hypothetical protein ACOMHN_042839 [Nucella lapillus]
MLVKLYGSSCWAGQTLSVAGVARVQGAVCVRFVGQGQGQHSHTHQQPHDGQCRGHQLQGINYRTVQTPATAPSLAKDRGLAALYRVNADWKLLQKLDPCRGALTFRCADGSCIQSEWVCDTDNDCLDHSDEVNCTTDCTGPHQFRCGDSRCVASEYRCDGTKDCADNEDELHCDQVECPPGEKKCANALCVEQQWFCNGYDDCGDNSDEKNCPTQGPCHDRHSSSSCARLNQTEHPICLNHIRASMFCKKFCNLCH